MILGANLTEALAFDAPVAQDDGYGGAVDGWEPRVACRGHLRYLRGGETVQAARLEGRQPVVATVRRSALTTAITPGWRLRDTRRDVVYAITALVPTEDRRWLEITAEAGRGA